MPYLLDSDTFSNALRGHPEVSRRLRAAKPGELYLSAVAAREALSGALAAVTAAEKPETRVSVEDAYRLLLGILEGISSYSVHPYSGDAEALYQSWPKSVQRVGPRDCRIAASALVSGMTVLTRNTRDFARIAEHAPALRFEDWSVSEIG